MAWVCGGKGRQEREREEGSRTGESVERGWREGGRERERERDVGNHEEREEKNEEEKEDEEEENGRGGVTIGEVLLMFVWVGG